MRRISLCRTKLLSLTGYGLAAVMGGALWACSPDPAPPLTFTTFQPASVVIGQADFTSGLENRGGSPAANTLYFAFGTPAVAATGRLYLPDYYNARVLGYHTVPTTNGAPADFVLGQSSFDSNVPSLTAEGMRRVETVLTYQGKLLVLDYYYNRVLIWNALPTTNNVPADVVVGQPNKTTGTTGCTAAQLYGPESMAVIDGKLVVAEGRNNRLLVWNSIPTTDGVAADLVLGQPNFTTCAAGTTRTTFDYPTDVVTIGGKLVVVDRDNIRVLIWNTVPSSAATPPDVVLGQPDFTSRTVNNGGLSARSLGEPYKLATDGTRLALTDGGNNRVLIWHTVPTCTPAPEGCASTTGADVVLGQPDFTTADVTPPPPTSAQTFDWPGGLYFNGPNQLFVADWGHSRFLLFNAHP